MLALARFVLYDAALAIIYTWVFNHTQGSVLLALLLHASANTTIGLLEMLHVEIAADLPILMLNTGLAVVWELVLVLITGPARLSRGLDAESPVVC